MSNFPVLCVRTPLFPITGSFHSCMLGAERCVRRREKSDHEFEALGNLSFTGAMSTETSMALSEVLCIIDRKHHKR